MPCRVQGGVAGRAAGLGVGWRGGSALAALLVVLGAAGPSWSAEPGVRTGDHPGYGRVVFDLPPGTTHSLVQEGDRAVLRLSPAQRPVSSPRAPRNVGTLDLAADGAVLVLAPGTRLRTALLGDRLILDALDAAPPAAAPPAAAPPAAPASRPAAPPRRVTGPVAAVAPDARERAAAPPPQPDRREPDAVAGRPDAGMAPATPPPPPTAPAVAPAAPPATPARATPGAEPSPRLAGRSLVLPFAAGTGAAAFRRGDQALAVFDERRPIDLAALRDDPQFGGAAITLLNAATVLRLKLPPGQSLRLAQTAAGWTLALVPAEPPRPALRPIRPELRGGRLQMAADAPGQVVAVPDPLTGGVLLVGTQIQPGQAHPVDRQSPEFTLLATWQGVAVLPASDGLTLRAATQGFVLTPETGPRLALSAPEAETLALAEASLFSRRFDFPPVAVEGLLRRLQSATRAAAAAPAQSRSALRLEVAQAMLALGMGVEAQSVLALAGIEDGRLAANPLHRGLSAVAALLAGRLDEADGLDDPGLTGSDEVALWRAVREALRSEGAPQAAAVFAATLRLLGSYPQPLRDRIAPLALETMALGGERAAAAEALAQGGSQAGLDLARAMVAEGADPSAALAIYDRLAQAPDRRLRARAGSRAAELRLATGAATPAQAADALERMIFAWRGDERELALRLRVAELRTQAAGADGLSGSPAGGGQGRRALALLRETAQAFPDSQDRVRQALQRSFARIVATDGTALPPLELVALADENPDLLPGGEEGRALAALLASRLMALDLPARAVPVLEKLAEAAPQGEAARAELGGTLAQARLAQGDRDGALAALAASMMVGRMPPPLLEQRTLTYARAAAGNGALAEAERALAALGTPPAHALRASLLEAARDWPGALASLLPLAAQLPAEGPLDEEQARLLLRLAGAAAQSGQDRLLEQLRARYDARLPAGRTAELFRLVTAAPVRGVADLPRAGREAGLARSVAGLVPVAK